MSNGNDELEDENEEETEIKENRHYFKLMPTLIVMMIILAIIIFSYYLKPTFSVFRTSPGVENVPSTEGSPTITTPDSANPRH
ncbi:MAG: hypothetical protein H0W88_12315 [Parachlamydiaceae bacterium]|nr:hypothetical protein [Parachlamydiaceae bacterium]